MHEKAEVPGIYDYEVKLLKLIEKISNGAKVEISKSGTRIKYYPGIITNNNEVDFEFDCGN
jgi:RNA 3'-terminal phosphate cyclase